MPRSLWSNLEGNPTSSSADTAGMTIDTEDSIMITTMDDARNAFLFMVGTMLCEV